MRTYIALVLMIQLGWITKAQTDDDKIHQTISNFLNDFPEQTQFSIGLIDGGDACYYGQVKFADTLNKLDNSSSVFQIGSVTKVFSATLLAQLVVNKQLRLSDSLTSFFDFQLQNSSITLEQLANHTSGLPRLPSNLNLASVDFRNPYQSYAEEDLIYYLTKEMKLSNKDEPAYQYSNLGFAVLAKAMEKASGSTYGALLSNYIFEPLEMRQTTLVKASAQNNLVQGLDAGGEPTPVWDMNQFEAAGELLSTTQDLTRFIRAHFGDVEDAYSITTLPTFLVNANLRIGLGWHILMADDGNNLYWHNGGTGGYSSSIFMIPETQKAVVLLTNVSAYHPKSNSIDELGFKLLDLF